MTEDMKTEMVPCWQPDWIISLPAFSWEISCRVAERIAYGTNLNSIAITLCIYFIMIQQKIGSITTLIANLININNKCWYNFVLFVYTCMRNYLFQSFYSHSLV